MPANPFRALSESAPPPRNHVSRHGALPRAKLISSTLAGNKKEKAQAARETLEKGGEKSSFTDTCSLEQRKMRFRREGDARG
jgi:hypothetical protein